MCALSKHSKITTIHIASLTTKRNVNDKSEVLSIQPDPSFSQNVQKGTGIFKEGVQAVKLDVDAEWTKAFPSENREPKALVYVSHRSVRMDSIPDHQDQTRLPSWAPQMIYLFYLSREAPLVVII